MTIFVPTVKKLILARTTRTPLKQTSSRCPLERDYSDVDGPIESTSNGCSKYFFKLLDEYSTYFILRFVKRKSMDGGSTIDMIKILDSKFNQNLGTITLTPRTYVRWSRINVSGAYFGEEPSKMVCSTWQRT